VLSNTYVSHFIFIHAHIELYIDDLNDYFYTLFMSSSEKRKHSFRLNFKHRIKIVDKSEIFCL